MRLFLAFVLALLSMSSTTALARPVEGVPCARASATYARGELQGHNGGLLYAQQRWLDPSTGRFLSLDPVMGVLNEPLSTQGFTYAHANPTGYTDPDGRSATTYGAGVLFGFTRNAPALATAVTPNGQLSAEIADAATQYFLSKDGSDEENEAIGRLHRLNPAFQTVEGISRLSDARKSYQEVVAAGGTDALTFEQGIEAGEAAFETVVGAISTATVATAGAKSLAPTRRATFSSTDLARMTTRSTMTSVGRPTGFSYTGAGYRDIGHLEAATEAFYREVREVGGYDDVHTVAKNSGSSVEDVMTMKKHVFFDEHTLPLETPKGMEIFNADGGPMYRRGLFTGNDDIASAWKAARTGPLTPAQADAFARLLRHEVAEAAYEASGIPHRIPNNNVNTSGKLQTEKGAHTMAPNPGGVFPGGEFVLR